MIGPIQKNWIVLLSASDNNWHLFIASPYMIYVKSHSQGNTMIKYSYILYSYILFFIGANLAPSPPERQMALEGSGYL